MERIPNTTGRPITEDQLKEVVASLMKSSNISFNIFDFQNAVDAPNLEFHEKLLTFGEHPENSLGTASSKFALFKNRFEIIRASLLAVKEFHRSIVQGLSSASKFSLLSINSLLPYTNKNVLVLGILDGNENTFSIEDDSGSVIIDISDVKYSDGIFPLGCVVLVEGFFTGKLIHVSTLAFCPSTTRQHFLLDFWKEPTDPFGWGLSPDAFKELNSLLTTEHSKSLILAFSDVWIDIPSVITDFNAILSKYDELPPNILIITGSFTSQYMGIRRFEDFKILFEKFATIIASHHDIIQQTKIIFIPSLNDFPYSKVFPRPPLLKPFKDIMIKAFKNVDVDNEPIFLSNPSRIRFLDQTITIFRHDIMRHLSNAAVLPVSSDNSYQKLAKTLIEQRHLTPTGLDIIPVAWPYDYAMRLFPTPDVLFLCDSYPRWTTEINNCTIINPGQFGNEKTYAQYFPATKIADLCDVNGKI